MNVFQVIIKPILLLSFFLIFTLKVDAQQKNLAQYRIVTHSSSVDVNHSGHLVVDGSLDTYWEGYWRDKNQQLIIDLGSTQEIEHIEVNWGGNYAISYNLSASIEEGDHAVELYKTSEGKGGNQTIAIKPTQARYIQINISKVLNPIRGSVIREMKIIGEGPDRFLPLHTTKLSVNNLSLNGDMWQVQNAMFVDADPEVISTTAYNNKEWIPARVPGTVLGDYYNFGALPDPLYGDNMHQISDEFFSGNNFWYRTVVDFPSELSGQRIFINFSGINWKSEVYFNGKYLGRIDGAFLRGEFDVTKLVNFEGENTLAVLVHNNENWVSNNHKVIRKSLGSRTTNGDVLGLDGPTSLASAGWNWLPIIKGRNNGIWNAVTFRTSGNISIQDPWVSSTLNLPDTTKADLRISTALKNYSSKPVEGKLIAKFDDKVIELLVKLRANEEKTVTLDKTQFSALEITNPKLWWPNGYGPQNLTKLDLQFIENNTVSDTKTIQFGIRDLEYKEVDNVLFVYCNGYRILLRGGNWGLPEAMMRLDEEGYDLRVKLQKEANFNMIRNWLGMTNHEAFYEACDKYGILVFDDFWLANPADGPNPKDHKMFMNNAKDKIKWVRKHPSLAFYCGRNEGIPLLELDVAMEKETESLDGTRFYISNSAGGTLSGFGPYDVRSSEWYFENRGRTFHSELGIIAIPEVESIRKMMPAEDVWPISDMWAIHDYQQGRSEKFTETIINRYGEPNSVEEYSNKAQLFNYESGKAMMESLQSAQGSGNILWMSQSAWPSLICQLYDHYLEYTASYFAVKKASSPIHAFWDSHKNEIRIANNTISNLKEVEINASVYGANGDVLWSKSLITNVASTSVKTCFDLEHQPADRVLFLKLELTKNGKVISDNFYWLENKDGNCLDLNDLPVANVKMKIKESHKKGYYTAQITLKNQSDHVSLLNKIKVKDKITGESILPVFFDDDYISLFPNEERTIQMQIEEKYLEGKSSEILLEGWNTKPVKMNLSK
ncbi:glycosyl hydrolase 2 galactose-binding domain-containing protein [Formosa sp. PL04]|uniref:glycosyl hydrolase 2 galactose-binding domain-containing protein n=1 Tax=Formosa sp. PL04 TaxID=3081755 RepID=UPI0029814D47|nr:discoidin domain-containing protein [Formosa sp. PL04]MDW5290977.1 discoidin domain-containing protein [Formosa sp. PL04]